MQTRRFIQILLLAIALLTTGRVHSTSNAQRSSFNAQRSTSNAQRSTFNAQRSTSIDCPLVRIDVKRLPDLNIPRTGHYTFCINDEVVVMGGHTSGFVPTATAEYFSNGAWHQIPMVYKHDQGFALQLSSGKVMIGGGHEQDLGIGQIYSVEIYDPTTHKSEGFGCLSHKRCFANAVELDSGRVVLSGNWYHRDGIEQWDGLPIFTDIDTLCVPRSCPYVFRTTADDALIFSRLDTRGNFVDSIVVENTKGDTIDVPLFREWHPFQMRPTVVRSSDSFIGDTANDEYAYLLPVENAQGELAVALVSGTQFSLIPTVCPLPRRSPWGDIFYTTSHFIADREAGRAYLLGKDEHRLYILCIDYAQTLNSKGSTLNSQIPPASVTLYFTELLEELGDNNSPVLTPQGDLILAGGMAPDNFVPTATVLQLCLGQHSRHSTLNSKLSPLNSKLSPWVWGCMALAAALILLIIYVHMRERRKKKRLSVSQGEEAESSESFDQDDLSDPANESDFDYGALFNRLDTLMTEEQLYLRPDLKVSDVASPFGTSSRRISNAIKMRRECSFSQYVNTYRVEHAKRLLREQPYKKIAAIWRESGFASETNFFRTFKAFTDKTPTEWLQVESVKSQQQRDI